MCAATTTHSIGRDGYSKVHIVSQVPALNMYEALLVIHEAHSQRPFSADKRQAAYTFLPRNGFIMRRNSMLQLLFHILVYLNYENDASLFFFSSFFQILRDPCDDKVTWRKSGKSRRRMETRRFCFAALLVSESNTPS